MKDNIHVKYKFDNLSTALIGDIKDLIDYNIQDKLDSYIQKILKKEDAQIFIDVNVEKNKKGLYDGIFNFSLDGDEFRYEREGFKIPTDLVNNAFDHLKEYLSKKEAKAKKK